MAEISQYLVNHLVTFSLHGEEVRSIEEALSRLSLLARTDRLWSQSMVLEVRPEVIRLRDAQNQEELEVFPVPSIYCCRAVLTDKIFPSLLLLVCQNGQQKNPEIHFFNCHTVGAELIQDDITSAVSDYTSKTNKRREVLRMNQTRMQQPQGLPRSPGAVRVMGIPNPPLPHAPNPPPSNPPPYPGIIANGSSVEQTNLVFQRAAREVEILNHCFNDFELFMGRLQKSSEAHSVLSQRSKKRKSNKKDTEDDLLTLRARPPTEDEFVDIFRKFKYSFCLLARLKPYITNPSSEELIHHIFKPLDMIVRTTGGPRLGATVSSPALTTGATTLLRNNLTEEERLLWTELGPYWTLPRAQLKDSVAPYTPVFLDGWKSEGVGPEGQVWEDPIESQHKQDALKEKQEQQSSETQQFLKPPVHYSSEMDRSASPVEEGRLYRCSYDFVARNNSELSVLQGETLEVIESSKRWWKCRNRFNEIGFVPFNILEPLSVLKDTPTNSPSTNRQSKASVPQPVTNDGPLAPTPLNHNSSMLRPHNMPSDRSHSPSRDSTDKVLVMNEELLQRLASGKVNIARPLVIPRSSDTSAPLDYHSPPSEVKDWLRGKGFTESTVQCLGVLTGAQLFSLNKDELRAVSPEEGARVYSQIMVQKALLEDARKATELEAVMEKQKMKVDLKMEGTTL